MTQEEALFRRMITQAYHESKHGKAEGTGKETPLIRLVDMMIQKAIDLNASDLHIEPGEKGVRLRFRCDGLLREDSQILPKELVPLIVSRLKVMAGMDIAKHQVPQDGHISYQKDDVKMDIRVSSLPVKEGEVMVLRLMNLEEKMLSLDELGFTGENLAAFRSLIRCPSGMNIVVGPVNSGKSTTLYAALAELRSVEANIVSLEDPVERHMEGVNQVQVNEKTGLDYLQGLKALLRQDVDKILLGEIRDAETAEMAVRIALTGHLLMTTMHTENATAAVFRMLEMGVPAYLLAAVLTGVVAQRLVRRICPHCKETYEVDAGSPEASLLGENWQSGLELWHGNGCEHCGGSGYLGRIALHEVLLVTPAMREAILAHTDRAALQKQAEKDGLRTLWQDGLVKVMAGKTDLREIKRVIYG